MALLILAGLQMIPADVYEAAKVDGATAWQRFRMITLPLVKPALMVAMLFRTMDALRMYDLPAIMMGSNPATSHHLGSGGRSDAVRRQFGVGAVHHHVPHHLRCGLHPGPIPRSQCGQHAGKAAEGGAGMNKALRGKIGTYIGVVLIIVWGLAPCYWMIVTALRDPADTFSTSLWPTQSHAVQLHRGARSRREGELHPGTDATA